MATIGYARVSSTGQNLDRQTDALTTAGCDRVFVEKMSGAKAANRPELAACLDYLRPGDVLVVTELARLGRSLLDLIGIVNGLAERSVEFRSLKEHIDTTTPAGRLTFNIMGALAEFEREVINQRAAEGRAAAKSRGQTGGRPRVDPTKVDAAKALVAGGMSASAAAKATGISRATLYREGIGTVTAN
jgi:DNA invertase Pin-like site-specific DNA recombinase